MKVTVIVECTTFGEAYAPPISYERELDLGLPLPSIGWDLYLQGLSAPATVESIVRMEAGRTYLVCAMRGELPETGGLWRPVNFDL